MTLDVDVDVDDDDGVVVVVTVNNSILSRASCKCRTLFCLLLL